MQVKTFLKDTLENLRKYVKSNFVGKEKVPRGIKSILQEYIEIVLDGDAGGLYKLRETIVSTFLKTFDLITEMEFFSECNLYFNISNTSAKVRKLAVEDPFQTKQPDMIGKIVVNVGKFAYEVMFGEVTGEDKNNPEKKNLIELIRLGLYMKDSLDLILQETMLIVFLLGKSLLAYKQTVKEYLLAINMNAEDIKNEFYGVETNTGWKSKSKVINISTPRVALKLLTEVFKERPDDELRS
ncbi:38502_t:CDS:2, partial [Gigaspora margarita]